MIILKSGEISEVNWDLGYRKWRWDWTKRARVSNRVKGQFLAKSPCDPETSSSSSVNDLGGNLCSPGYSTQEAKAIFTFWMSCEGKCKFRQFAFLDIKISFIGRRIIKYRITKVCVTYEGTLNSLNYILEVHKSFYCSWWIT